MHELSSSTAILFFARTANEESKHKQLLDEATNRDFFTILRGAVLQTLNNTGYPVIDHSEAAQFGDSFGSRLAHGINSVFQKGFEQVIVVGSDSPDLSVEDIHQSAKALRRGHVVVGPDLRGGVYLFGLRKEDFDFDQFKALPWQQSILLRSIENYFDRSLHYLATRFDLNERDQLIKFRNRSRLLRRILVALTNGHWELNHAISFYSLVHTLNDQLRGPPQRV